MHSIKKHCKLFLAGLLVISTLLLSACSGPAWQSQEDQQMTYASNSNATYKDFNKSEYESMKGKAPFVLFFHAQWCSTCVELEKNIKAELQQFPMGTIIYKVNYDTEEDLKKEYKVSTQSVFVIVDAQGQISETLVAPNKAQLVKAIQKVSANTNAESAAVVEESSTAEEEANESPETKAKEKTEAEAKNTEVKPSTAKVTSTTAKPAQYLSYSASAVAANHGQEAYALFFHAPWCPVCVGMEADIKASLSDFPAGSKIFKADFDTELDLRKQYGITTQSTIVIIGQDGKVVEKLTGPKASRISSSLAKVL